MDGLVDYVRRQVKCPECRAEHRIPYQVRTINLYTIYNVNVSSNKDIFQKKKNVQEKNYT